MRWQGWRENLKQRREHFRLRLQEHLSRIGKDGKCSRAGFSRVGCLILIKLRLFGVIFCLWMRNFSKNCNFIEKREVCMRTRLVVSFLSVFAAGMLRSFDDEDEWSVEHIGKRSGRMYRLGYDRHRWCGREVRMERRGWNRLLNSG